MMRATIRLPLKIAKWTMAAVAGIALANGSANQTANAHFGHFGHFGHHHHHLGFYGGFGYSPFYYTSYRTSYYGFASPYYYSAFPVFVQPRIITYRPCVQYVPAPTYYFSTYTPTTVVTPTYVGGVTVHGIPVASSNTTTTQSPNAWASSAPSSFRNSLSLKPQVSLASTDYSTRNVDAPLMLLRDDQDSSVQTASADIQIGDSPSELGTKYVASKPALVQPYSPIWTKAAAGIVDDMISEGQLEDALASCKSMEKIEQSKGAGVYLRQALINYFGNRNNNSAASTEEVLNLLEQACATGSQLDATELSKGSLHEYFGACSVDVDDSMTQLSRWILENPNKSGRELLLLTALLKLDGQAERAKLFASEAERLAAKSGAFHWTNLLTVCKE